MKKIISLSILVFFLGTSFSFACTSDAECQLGVETCQITPPLTQGSCVSIITNQQATQTTTTTTSPTTNQGQCPGSPGCPGYSGAMSNANANQTTTPAGSVNGITINQACLTNGQCKFNIYDTLGIRKSVRATGDPTSVGLFVQDIVLSATFFIGTVVTVALIVSGLMYIFAAASGKDPTNAKKGITGALIGLVLVACSYFIIRLIQYLAKGV